MCVEDAELTVEEQIMTAAELLFQDIPKSIGEIQDGIRWFLSGYNHDRMKKKKKDRTRLMDFKIDQWRIYAAFKSQYNINLNRCDMHWFEFMGLMNNLEECAFTRVIDIRNKKIEAKMPKEQKKQLIEAKEVFLLGEPAEVITEVQKQEEEAAVDEFLKFTGK